MKKRIFISLVSLTTPLLVLLSCTVSSAPTQQVYPTQSYLTPASMEAIIGKPVSVVPVGNDWGTYYDPELGIQIQYPPDWTAVKLPDALGVGFYPPGSAPDLPAPAITFRFLNQPYVAGQSLFDTGSAVAPFYIAGVAGQQYRDTKFAIPNQSSYIELPYGDGLLLIEATLGPNIDLTPQLLEMLKTLNLSAFNMAIETPTLIPVSEQWIAFDSNCSGNFEVYKLKLDGTELIQLTYNSVDDGDAVLSPDGTHVAFFSEQDGDREIYTMRVDGTDIKRLTYSPNWDGLPAWSPDSKRIAFTSWREDEVGIFIMNIDGTDVWKLTSSPGGDWMPRWSPDGKQIAFASYVGNDISEIFIVNSDGTNRTQLTQLNGTSLYPRWSPDGNQIVFSYGGYEDNQIFVMNRDGSDIRFLIQIADAVPIAWLQDGSEIVFGTWDGIYIMNADGSNIRLIREMRIVC